MAHNPEDSAGIQLALVVAVKLLLSAYRGNQTAAKSLEDELESMRANLLASNSSEQKIHAFNEAAEALLATLK